MLKYSRRIEDSPHGASNFHGTGGPVKLCDQSPNRPTNHPFFVSAAEEGLPVLDDFFGNRQEDAHYLQLTASDNTRQSNAVAYLNPSRRRPNLTILTILTETFARRIELDGYAAAAISITHEHGGALHTLAAREEVIVSAGAIGSAQLLMVSGIGPAAQLDSLGIEVVIDSPGVGQNLHDHPAVIMTFTATQARGSRPTRRAGRVGGDVEVRHDA
jgi:choline dehydrogenase